ncbi:MAG TPA: hypothetical protein VG501_02215 [Rhizomicrobium sp.]|nr:hypothetical protein [Rhizomicrobium sp.]
MRGQVSYDEFVEQCRRERRSLLNGISLAADDLMLMQRPYGDMGTILLNGLHEQVRLLDRCLAAYDRHLH